MRLLHCCTQFTQSTIKRVFRSSFYFAVLPTSQMNFRLHFLLASVCILIYVNETIASSSSSRKKGHLQWVDLKVECGRCGRLLTACLMTLSAYAAYEWLAALASAIRCLLLSLPFSLSLSLCLLRSFSFLWRFFATFATALHLINVIMQIYATVHRFFP